MNLLYDSIEDIYVLIMRFFKDIVGEDQVPAGMGSAGFQLVTVINTPLIYVPGNHEVYNKKDRETVLDGVRVINAFGYYVFEV